MSSNLKQVENGTIDSRLEDEKNERLVQPSHRNSETNQSGLGTFDLLDELNEYVDESREE